MNRNVMIVLAGGFLIAVLVALLVQASLSGGKKETVEKAPVEILVASKNLKLGAQLSDENMRWQTWPENAVLKGSTIREGDKTPSEMLSGRLRRSLDEGEPILQSAIIQAEGSFIAAALVSGKRAYAIEVDAATMAGGFIGPGDYVDVILAYRESIHFQGDDEDNEAIVQNMIQLNIDDLASETILENVKVLAVDQSPVREDDEEGKVKVGKTVTLEVDREGAEILALASSWNPGGDLSLALRGIGDDAIEKEKRPVVTDSRMTSAYREVLEEVSKVTGQVYTGQASNFVRIYRGQEVESLSVPP